MIKAPPWLFSAESDLYIPPRKLPPRPKYSGDRVTSRYWGMVPPPHRACPFRVYEMARL